MSAAVEMDDVDLGLQPEPEPEPASKSADEEDEQYDVGPSVSFVREGKAELEGLRLGGDGISVASFERAALGHQLSPNGSDNVDAAGLAVGSEIVSVDGWRVKNARHLRRKLKKVPEGNTVSLRFAVPGGRHSRQPSYDKQQHSSKELRVRLDLTRETTVTVQMKDSVSDLKGRIAKAAVKQGVKGSSAEGYADGAFLVIAVVGERGVRTVLPDELSMRDAMMYAERGENEVSKEQINYVYLVKYHVPASWRTVGCVRYSLAALWTAMGVVMLTVALTNDARDCNTEDDLKSGPDSCSPKRPKMWKYDQCWYCDQWFDHPDRESGLLRSVDPADNPAEFDRRVSHLQVVAEHCEELQLFAYVCALFFIVTGLLLASMWFVRNRQLVHAFKKRRQRGRVRHPALKDKQWAKCSEILLPILPVTGWLLLQSRFWSTWAEFHCGDDIHAVAGWIIVPTWVFAPAFCCALPCFTNNAFYQFMTPDAEEPGSADGRKLYCCCCNIYFWARRSGRNPLASEWFAAEQSNNDQKTATEADDRAAPHGTFDHDDMNP